VSTALDENGWVCGHNSHGQLGVGNTADLAEPQSLKVARRWAAISLGGSHAAGVTGQGEVYTWGLNDKGQLGMPTGPGESKDVPRRMELLVGWNVKAISCGAEHTIAITPEDVITWGSNEYGQCGHGDKAETDWVKPRSIKMLHEQMVTQVICGRFHTLCVTATSQVYAWGRNGSGQLGLGDTQDRRGPTLVEGLWALPVQQLAAGDAHSVALTSNGFLFTWGSNDAGQLGLPHAADVATQIQASRTASERKRVNRRVNQRFLTAMAEMGIPSDQAELALHETGNVGVEVATEWLFSVPQDVLETHLAGEPGTPQEDMGTMHEDDRVLAPKRVPLQGVRFVAAGSLHTVALTDEEVYSWGDNSAGQLGNRTFRGTSLPSEVVDLAGRGVVQVACGARHTLFVCHDGEVYGCGSSQHGQLPAGCSTDPDTCRPAPDGSGLLIATPTRLRLRFLEGGAGASAPVVSQVVAGAHSSAFLTRASDELPDAPPPRLWERLQAAVSAAHSAPNNLESDAHVRPIAAAVERIFSSAAAISAAFGVKDCVGMDGGLLESMQRAILELEPPAAPKKDDPQPTQDSLFQAFRKAMEVLVMDLERNIKLLGTPERAQVGWWALARLHPAAKLGWQMVCRTAPAPWHLSTGTPPQAPAHASPCCASLPQVLLAAMQSQLLGDSRVANTLIPRVCNAVLAAPSSTRHLLVKWWAEYPAELLETRVVKPLQKYLTDELYATKKLTISVMNVIKVLAKVEEANQLGRQLPPDAFYNELISEKLDVLDHYVAWRQTHDMPQHASGTDGPFSFCSYPFLLNPRAKSKLLHTEARIQMDQTVAQSRLEQQSASNNGSNSARGQRRAEEEECVVPNEKARLSSALRTSGEGPPGSSGRAHAGGTARRRDRQGGLRWLFNSLRTNDGPQPSAGSSLQDDERRMMGRQINGTSEGVPGSLWKQGSLNLPAPEESGFPATHPDMCILRIRRNHLLEDALDEIARQKPKDLFKPLRVHFIGEDGIDAGGVKKEFFQLLVTELLCPDYGMLIYQPESRTYWFNPTTLEADAEFLLLGLVLGLAIYNGVLLDFPLPLALYRKILGQEVKLRDLEDMQPTLGRWAGLGSGGWAAEGCAAAAVQRLLWACPIECQAVDSPPAATACCPLCRSLRQMLQYEGPGSVEDVFCQTFTVEVPGFGDTRVVPLKEGGADVPVIEENRREFVELYVDFWLNGSIHSQFEAFAKGFLMLCGGPALQLFSATELERLVCGNPFLDFESLQKHARYEGGYSPEHRVVQWLWQVVSELTQEERKLFLKFFTGSDRAPIGGLGNLRCIIQVRWQGCRGWVGISCTSSCW
jgi:ubiquitin-protein ligase E3 A